jgi:hypothetical protein
MGMKIKSILLGLFMFWSLAAPLAHGQGVSATVVHNKATVWLNSFVNVDVTVYFTCDAMENDARNLLKKLGAANITAHCWGGASPERPTISPTLNLEFDSLRSTSGDNGQPTMSAIWANVVLKNSSDCEVTRQLFTGVEKYFEIQNLIGVKSCWHPSDSYKYTFSTLAQTME